MSLLAVGASIIALSGCSAGGPTTGGDSSEGAASTRACVILPDADSGTRWERGDRPALDKALKDAGYDTDIQNAKSDTTAYATIADQQLAQGCGVMILIDYQGAAIQVAAKAKAQGIPVIAYDRPIEGADYYVSFDNFHVGELQGQSLLDGLEAAGVDPKAAQVIYVGGDATDGNAKQFHDGADSILKAAGVVPVFETKGTWVAAEAGTAFEQAYTTVQGNLDGVWVANDTNAQAVIAVLDKNGKKIPVTGQDASIIGLQNVLLGKQVSTIYKPFTVEADAASKLAIQILGGESPSVADKTDDGVPYVKLDPEVITPDKVVDVIDGGDATYADVCTADVKAACDAAGLTE
ncbi:sugar ABC transporter substrate-binding protein [Naasia lichenicola]|uniref:Sugar ABC transporter substrate-binding protein n=1 Tax=Naasia lichenicola TaxID=2565933 RepID=A0A4S4FUQ1_9MICO|nr:sugar ABC transporter substrate-binding protein [Naasia lichenicola]